MDAREALAKLGGFGTTRKVAGLSSPKRVRTALARGEIIRVGRNRLALPTADRAHEAARAVNGWASHLSAAAHHGWELKWQPEVPQVTVPRGRGVEGKLPVLVELFRRDLPARERDGWATAALRTVLDCARDLPFDEALCVADSAPSARVGHRGGAAGCRTLGRTTAGGRACKRPGCQSVRVDPSVAGPCAGLETIPQYEIALGDLVMHPDLANPILGIVIEADSYEFHGRDKWDHNRDCLRYNMLVAAGWVVLRFTWEKVMDRPDYVIETIRAVISNVGRPLRGETSTRR